MNQKELIQEVDSMLKTLQNTGDKLVAHNQGGIPDSFKVAFDEWSSFLEDISAKAYSVLDDASIDWYGNLIYRNFDKFQEFNFEVALRISKTTH